MCMMLSKDTLSESAFGVRYNPLCTLFAPVDGWLNPGMYFVDMCFRPRNIILLF